MRKKLLLISILVATSIVIAACGNSSANTNSTDASGQATSQLEEKEVETKAEAEPDADNDTSSVEKEITEAEAEPVADSDTSESAKEIIKSESGSNVDSDTSESAKVITGAEAVADKENIEETLSDATIYNDNDIIVVVNGISSDKYGKNVDITITNNSERDISWNVEEIIVNDITTTCAVSYDIPAGKTGKGEYPFEEAELERYGITDIYTLQLICELKDSETYDTIDYCTSKRLISDLGSDFNLSLPINDWTKIYESESITLYYTGIIEEGDEYDDYKSKAVFMCFNGTESTKTLFPEDVSFDNVMDYSNFYAFNVGPKSYCEFYLTSEENIAEKNEASFKLVVSEGSAYNDEHTIDNISVELK